MPNLAAATQFPLQARLFRGFADPSRLAILEALRDGPHTVGDIVAATGLTIYAPAHRSSSWFSH